MKKLTRNCLIATAIFVVSSIAGATTASAEYMPPTPTSCEHDGGTPQYEDGFEADCWWIFDLLNLCDQGEEIKVYAGCQY
jgi:hypothetical protein